MQSAGSKPMHLYETHLPVADTEKSRAILCGNRRAEFRLSRSGSGYCLSLGGHEPKINARALGTGDALWQGSASLPFRDCTLAPGTCSKRASDSTIWAFRRSNFSGETTTEPSVIGWMPSAQLYFRDPDGHSVEFITLLDDPPDPRFHRFALGVAEERLGAPIAS